MEIKTYGKPLNSQLKDFDPQFDDGVKLDEENIMCILWWLNVHNSEVDMDERDVIAFKKLIKLLPDNVDKVSVLYSANIKLNGQL